MEPLSARTRRLYLTLFVALFFAVIPVAIFFADGWRYKAGYGFVRTGGIYISVPYPDARVSFNGALIGQSGFLERSFFVNNLAPSGYIVHVEKSGYYSWDRLLVVNEQLVTDARALLIPKEIPIVRILAATSSSSQSSTSTIMIVSRATFATYTSIFASSTIASTTIPVDESNGLGLFLVKGKLVVRWIQENAFPPSIFCSRPSECVTEIPVADSGVISARFFHGGVVYATKAGKVYFAEADIRPTPLLVPLYSAKGADIRIISDTVLVKSGTNLYEIQL